MALRIARRSSRRALGRSTLIVALIVLPVAGMAAISLVIPSTVATGAEKARAQLGHADASITMAGDSGAAIEQNADGTGWGGTAQVDSAAAPVTLADRMPSGFRAIPVLALSVTVHTATGQGAMDAGVGAVWDPVLRGRYTTLAGRAPASTDEVVVTPAALQRLGARVGGTVRVILPHQQVVTIVGTIRPRVEPSDYQAIYGVAGAFGTPKDLLSTEQTTAYLTGGTVSWHDVRALNRRGLLVVSRDALLHPPALPGYDGSGMASSGAAFLVGGMVVAFILIEVVLLAAAAFLVGARAQERSLATLASVGGTRSSLVAVISTGGVVLGAVGGVLGVAVGIGAGSLVMGLTADGSAAHYWGYHLWWPLMAAIAGGAMIIGWLAALVPALRASRFDVVAALRGARRPHAERNRRPIFGAVVVAVGTLATIAGGVLDVVVTRTNDTPAGSPRALLMAGLLIGGPVLIIVGLLLTSGLVLRVAARLFSRGTVSMRMATRDAARNRGRSVPTLAAVLVTVFVAVFAMTMMSSSESTQRRHYNYRALVGQVTLPLHYEDVDKTRSLQPSAVTAAARAVFPTAKTRVLTAVPNPAELTGLPTLPAGTRGTDLLPSLSMPRANQCPADPGSANYDKRSANDTALQQALSSDPRCTDPTAYLPQIWVGDTDDLAAIIGHAPSTAAAAALADGGAVAIDGPYVSRGKVTIAWTPAEGWLHPDASTARSTPARTATLPAVVQPVEHALPYGILISPAVAHRLALSVQQQKVLVSPVKAPSQAQIDELNQRVEAVIGRPGMGLVTVETGPSSTASLVSWLLLALSGVIAVGAAAVAIGLARFDGRRDQATLGAVGASPGTRRAFGFWQAIVLTGTGAILGSAVGLVPAIALTLPGLQIGLTPPWTPIIATALGLPLAIAALVWLVPGRRVPLAQRAAIE